MSLKSDWLINITDLMHRFYGDRKQIVRSSIDNSTKNNCESVNLCFIDLQKMRAKSIHKSGENITIMENGKREITLK